MHVSIIAPDWGTVNPSQFTHTPLAVRLEPTTYRLKIRPFYQLSYTVPAVVTHRIMTGIGSAENGWLHLPQVFLRAAALHLS